MKLSESFSEEELKEFARRVIAEGIDARGFGVPSKAELEVLMFDQLIRSRTLNGKSNYELAAQLRIPESRVKALLLTSSLRHSPFQHGQCVREVLERCMNDGTLKDLEQSVQLSIENPAKRREVEHALKICGETAEYGRNREILVFRPEALLALLGMYLGKNEDDFLNWLKMQTKDKEVAKELREKSIPFKERVLDVLKKTGNLSFESVVSVGTQLAFKAAGLPTP